MSNFVPRVHDGYLFGSDTAFGHFSPPLTGAPSHITTTVPPAQVHPATSTVSREAEMRYYDEVANMVYSELPTTGDDDFREIVLLTDVNTESTTSTAPGAAGGQKQQQQQQHHHDPRRPWRGTVCEMRMGQDGASRYFIPARMLEAGGSRRRTTISLYHHATSTTAGNEQLAESSYAGLRDYSNLFAGKVVGVIGSVIQRDAVSNEIIGVAVTRIITPKVPAPANPLPLVSNSDAAINYQQRLHFVPLPPYTDAQSEQLDLFLRDVIHYLGGSRGSSLIVFCGAIAPDEKASEGKSSYDRMAMNAIQHAQRVSEDPTLTLQTRAGLAKSWQQQPQSVSAVPIAFVPHVDDITMTPPMLPQTGAAALFAHHNYTETAREVVAARDRAAADEEDDEEDQDDEEEQKKKKKKAQQAQQLAKPNRLGLATDLAGNPGEFVFLNGLRVVATSVDLQSALSSHAVTSPHANRNGTSWRLQMMGRSVRESLLLLPYLMQGCDEYNIEPSSLSEVRRASAKTAPHIFFTPTSVAGPQACFVDGSLFVSCTIATAHSLRIAASGKSGKFDDVGLGRHSSDQFQMMEVDVADARSFSPETVRVKCIDFVRKPNN